MRTFGEMGVDSMAAIEVKHMLESTCDVTLTMKEIQELKIDDVRTLIEKAESDRKKRSPTSTFVSTISADLPRPSFHPQPVQLINNIQEGTPVFIIDIGCYDLSPLKKLALTVESPVYTLLLSKDTPTSDVKVLARWYLEVSTISFFKISFLCFLKKRSFFIKKPKFSHFVFTFLFFFFYFYFYVFLWHYFL